MKDKNKLKYVIGYQGDIGSNNEIASLKFAKNQGWLESEYKLVACISSYGVVSALVNKEVTHGVMATQNVIGGIVFETKDALQDIKYDLIETMSLPIIHCLCKLKNISIFEVDCVVSHIQALKQTTIYMNNHFPQIKKLEYKDTALAAKDLSLGKLFPNNAVITTEWAAKLYDLDIIEFNVSDREDNLTDFIMIKDCIKLTISGAFNQ